MGNDNLKQTSFIGRIMCCDCCKSEFQAEQLKPFANQYISIQLVLDPYYGQCYSLENIDGGKTHILLKDTINIEERMVKAALYSQLKKSSDGPANQNIVFTDIIASVQRPGCFRTTYDLYILHDRIVTDLLKQFESRLRSREDFNENEIKAIMKSCAKGFTRLELQPYNSLRMKHIYFCGAGKDIKIAHPNLFNHVSNLAIIEDNYNAAALEHIYLSPEELSAYERNDLTFAGGWISNAFCFGMVLLSLMAMKHLDYVYNYQSCEIDQQQIDNLFHQCHEKYSFPLITMVQDLLKTNQNSRLTFKDLLARIQGSEPANKYVNELVLNILGQKEQIEDEDDDEEQEVTAKDVLPQKKVKFPNYIAAYLKPSISLNGEYARLNQEEPIHTRHTAESVIANQRLRYTDSINKQPRFGSYIGQAITIEKDKKEPIRQGKGLYRHQDGQTYIGDWHKGQMHGYGKLYYANKQLRYEGEFKNGLFHGTGTEYSDKQIKQREDQIDETYVKMFKGNWIRYQGNYETDKRNGAGKVFFRKGYWRGNFKNGQPNGQGSYYSYRDEKETKGRWDNGELISKL